MSARHVSTVAAALCLTVVTLSAQQPSPGQSPTAPAAQAPQTTFRSSLDLIAVDVQVIDREGVPVAGLGPDKFEVTINGRKRRVVSANLIESHSATTLSPAERAVAAPPAVPELARVVMIAVDCISIGPSAAQDVFETTRQFIDQLPATDEVGLFAYPMGPKINPTTDHAAISRALGTVMGQREPPSSRFHLRPSEIIDLTAAASGRAQEDTLLDQVAKRECGDPIEESCRRQLTMEITNAALYYEGQGNASLGMLRSLLEQLGSITGRKTLVLISGGMMASDSPGGRPDINELGLQVGKEAARSNTSIYTLFLDSSFLEGFAAETRSSMKNLENVARDSTVLSRWLEQFSGAAGGALFKVQVGSGQPSFKRILNETSAYYLLGVEPGEADRDGMTHEIKVKTTQRNVTLRGRRWVTVPKHDAVTTASTAESPPAAATTAPVATPKPAVPPRRAIPAEIKTLAAEFERAEEDLQRGLARTGDLANTIRAFRGADSPWPDSPNRTAVFALELAIAALRSSNQYARDEGGRLLAEYNTRVRRATGADAFECAWLTTEVVALEGLFMADSAMLFVPRAVERCPNEPRLRLAHAIVLEQQWLRRGAPAADEADVIARYEDAIKYPDTAAEARVRAAWFLYRTGKLPEALAMIENARPAAADREVSYLRDLVGGQLLRATGKSDEAAAEFRAALTTWPGAQSARVALMTLLLVRGDRREAAALANAVETAPDDHLDPWWTFWLGDYRSYPAILGKLREMGR